MVLEAYVHQKPQTIHRTHWVYILQGPPLSFPALVHQESVSVKPLKGLLSSASSTKVFQLKGPKRKSPLSESCFFTQQLSAGISSTSWDKVTVCFVCLLTFLFAGYHSQSSTCSVSKCVAKKAAMGNLIHDWPESRNKR